MSSGIIERGLQNGWIGDSGAFERYQEAYHSYSPVLVSGDTPDEQERSIVKEKMREAIRSVIQDPRFPSVAGFVTCVGSASTGMNGYHYLSSCEGFDFNPVTNTDVETSLIRPKGAQEGGYNYSMLAPRLSGIGALGIHFLQGQFGIVLHPFLSDEALEFRGVSADEFIQEVSSELGIRLSGIYWS